MTNKIIKYNKNLDPNTSSYTGGDPDQPSEMTISQFWHFISTTRAQLMQKDDNLYENINVQKKNIKICKKNSAFWDTIKITHVKKKINKQLVQYKTSCTKLYYMDSV